jgi:hypothetical protein
MEISIAIFCSTILFIAVLSAYSFLGRSLLRTGYAAQQESASRKTLYNFSSDVSTATGVSSASASDLVLNVSGGTVEYSYSSSAATLTRKSIVSSVTKTTTMLTGVSTLTFDYYDCNQNVSSATSAMKLIDIAFTTAAGGTIGDTRAKLPIQSARVMMRNKGYLQ